MKNSAVSISGLRHSWPGPGEILAIDEFEIMRGESVFLAGPSGSGKSTLLGLIAGVTPVQTGKIEVLDQAMDPAKPQARDRLRADQVGMVFQLFNLVPYLTAAENVRLPLAFSAQRRADVSASGLAPKDEATRLLGALGLASNIHDQRAAELSVGQQQRVAAARALIGAPGLIVADEPISALDEDSRDTFLDLLSNEARRNEAALLFVSHEQSLASRFERFVDLQSINRAGVPA